MTDFDDYAATYEKNVADSISLSGESVEYFAEMKAIYLAGLLGAGFNGKLLDFGCGVGLLARFVAKHIPAATLHGFDLSDDSIQRVPAELATRGRFTSTAAELDTDYDAVIVANVMHHVPPAQRSAVVGELANRLRTGGRLVVFEHNPINPATRWAVSHCAFDEDAVLLRARELRRYVEGARLRPVTLHYIGFFPRALRVFRPLEPRLRWCPAGAQYCMVAERVV